VAELEPVERPLGQRVLDALAPYLLTIAIATPFGIFYTLKLRDLQLHWQHKWALLLLAAVPLGAWVGFHLQRRRAGTLTFSRTHDLRRTPQGLFGRLLHLPHALRLVAIAMVAVALARPQRLTADTSEVEGIDIVIALDVSNSMSEQDLLPDRITAAKRVIDDFIRRRQSDRIGLVIFGKEAFTQCPLTLDNRALRMLLADVRLGLVDGQGTAIGNALGTAINRLRDPDCEKKPEAEQAACKERKHAKSKVVVLVTDGDDNASRLDPLKAAQYAQTFGIKVFTILIGRDVLAGEQPAGMDRFGNVITGRPRYPVNPKLLEKIAETTGGMPYLATDVEALEKRFQAILEDLDRSKLKAARPHYAELYPLFIAPALALVLLEILLSLTRFRRFP
jgi:Ca-activated chloride channel family protein